MLFRRLYNDSLAQAGYLVACQATRTAVVVDPLRDPAPYLRAASEEGVRITHVAETHVHADFVSGAAALARAAGAELLLSGEGGYQPSALAGATPVGDGDLIMVGGVQLEVLHTPGHTPEHLCFLVTDSATSEHPVGLLSGDFLFVGDVGRPDLLERAAGMQGTMESSARELFRALQRVRALPEFIQVWPGHGAGSACGKALGALPQSTLGFELRTNWAFGVTNEDEFVRTVLAGQPEPPAYFARMKRLNAEGAPPQPDDDGMAGEPADDVLVVDLRTAADFARGHMPGSQNVPRGKSFLAWAGSVLPPDRRLTLITAADAHGDGIQAARDLALIGLDRIAGVTTTDVVRDELSATVSSVEPSAIGACAADGVTVLDVRNRSEWEAGHIPGAKHVPLAELTARIEELRGAGPIAVHCQGGSRSAVAASMLKAAGLEDVSNVEGGYAAWSRLGHPPQSGA